MGQGRHANDLAHQLQRLVLRLNRALRAQNAGSGASHADAMVLAEVRHRPGLGVSELAVFENVARSVMSERVKRLQAAGLIASDPGLHQDRRRVGLVITDDGRELLEMITTRRRDWMAERLAVLSPGERDAVQVAVEALERIIGQRTATRQQLREHDHEKVEQ